MFVKTLKATLKIGGTALLFGTMSAASAIAADAPDWKSAEGTIPVTVELSGITVTEGPIYVSIQKRDQYMGMKGHGGIIKMATPGHMTAVYKVAEPGDYAVSVWHDTNDDGIFSMDENYRILDGYGSSGTPPADSRPTFDDVKITVESFGSTVTVPMNYPS